MAKGRMGHFVEAQILQEIGVRFYRMKVKFFNSRREHTINKLGFKVPYVLLELRNLGEATKKDWRRALYMNSVYDGSVGRYRNVVEAVSTMRCIDG